MKASDSPRVAVLYTLGLRGMESDTLIAALKSLRIDTIVDLRKALEPTKRAPPLSPLKLEQLSKANRIDYVNLSSVLGHRPDSRLLVLTDEFSNAISELTRLASERAIMIVCGEKDYRKCERKLVGSYLARQGVEIRHLGKGIPTDFQSTLEATMSERPMSRRLFTIGFTKKTMREFADLLRVAKVKRLVDIRLRPVSQYSGFARKEDLDYLLELLGIEYVYAPEFAPTDELLDTYRRNGDWQGYERGFRELLRVRHPESLLSQLLAPARNVAILCTEDEPVRCHRRLVAEYARTIFPDLEVVHLTSQGPLQIPLGQKTLELASNAGGTGIASTRS